MSLFLVGALSAGCSGGYKNENGKWAWVSWDEAIGRRVQFVDGADAGTFRVLSDPQYATDKAFVYYKNLKVGNADPATFRKLAGCYWCDTTRVFFVKSEIPGADPATFRPLPKSPWACDKNDVYTGTIALHVQDISTFTLLQGVWAKDAKAYYANGGILAYKTVPCDYSSFVVLNGSYARDKDRGYWQGMPVEGSDGSSFQAVTEFSAKDRNHEYRGPSQQNNQ